MFFCDDCAAARRWPTSMGRSFGNCEICDRDKLCSDVPSSQLPTPRAAQIDGYEVHHITGMAEDRLLAQKLTERSWLRYLRTYERVALYTAQAVLSYTLPSAEVDKWLKRYHWVVRLCPEPERLRIHVQLTAEWK